MLSIFICIAIFSFVPQKIHSSNPHSRGGVTLKYINEINSIQLKKEAHLIQENRSTGSQSESSPSVKNYTSQDALIRYKYQNDLLRHMDNKDYRGPKICLSKDHCLTTVPDKVLYTKDLQKFENMNVEDFITQWPEFKVKHKSLLTYCHEDILRKYDDRVRTEKCKNGYGKLEISKISSKVSDKFFKKHKEIVEPYLKGLVALELKALILYNVFHKQYASLRHCKHSCHSTIQEHIDNALGNKGQKSMKRLWEEGIKLIAEKNDIEQAGPLLSTIINKALSKGIGQNHQELLLKKAETILKEEKVTHAQREFLYVCSCIIDHNKGEDTFNILNRLCKTGYLKALLLKITSLSFDPSSYYRKSPMLFDVFYKLRDIVVDPNSEKLIVNSVNKHLSDNPYAFPFLLLVLPFNEGKYSKDFLHSFFKSEKNIQAAKTYNVFLSNPSFKLNPSIIGFNMPNSPYGVFVKKIINFLEISDKWDNLTTIDQIDKEVVNDFISYRDRENQQALKDKSNNESLLRWIDNFKYYMVAVLEGKGFWNHVEALDSRRTALKKAYQDEENFDEFWSKYCCNMQENSFTHNIALLGLAVKQDNQEKIELFKKHLRPLILDFLLKGSQNCFSHHIINPTSILPCEFFKMRDIIINKDSLQWKESIEKTENDLPESKPLVYAVLGTDILDYAKFKYKNFKDKNVSLEEHFGQMSLWLQKNVDTIYSMDFHVPQRLFFEKALLSMYLLSKSDNKLALEDKVTTIINMIKEKIKMKHSNIISTDSFISCSTSLGSVLGKVNLGIMKDLIKKGIVNVEMIKKQIDQNETKNKKK